MDVVDRLLAHDRWTTDLYLTICKELPDDQWDQEIDVSFSSLRNTFDHMIGSAEFWLRQMLGEPVGDDQPSQNDFESLIDRHDAVYDRFDPFVRQIVADGRLDDSFVNVWGGKQTFGTTILHVITHNQTHRTEILHILERLGVEKLPEGDLLSWEWNLPATA